MFEDLFVDPRTIANLWSAPLLEERLRYLRHCAQSGARPSTLRRIAAAQTSLVRLLDLREAGACQHAPDRGGGQAVGAAQWVPVARPLRAA